MKSQLAKNKRREIDLGSLLKPCFGVAEQKRKPSNVDEVFSPISEANEVVSPSDRTNYYQKMSGYLKKSLAKEII